jgi:hypothetical protein
LNKSDIWKTIKSASVNHTGKKNLHNKLKTILQDLILNPLFLAAPFAIIGFLLIAGSFAKFKTGRIQKIILPHASGHVDIQDLNNDGNSEFVHFFVNSKGKAAFSVTLQGNATLDQWNLNGIYPPSISFGAFDFDDDDNKEIVISYFRDDSLFLAIIKPFNQSKLFRQDVFVDVIVNRDDFIISDFVFADINSDNKSDILFAVNAGFGLFPRNVYAYDFHQDKILKSDYLALHLRIENEGQIVDIDGDGRPEIILSNSAPGNMRNFDSDDLHDHAVRILILDHNLKIKAEPLPFAATPSNLIPYFIKDQGRGGVLCFFNNYSTGGDTSCIALFDFDQKEITGQINMPGHRNHIIYSKSNETKVSFYNEKGDIYQIDKKLILNQLGQLHGRIHPSLYAGFDINGSGDQELIFGDKDYLGYWVLTDNFKHPAFLPIPEEAGQSPKKIMLLQQEGKPNSIAIHINSFLYVFSYSTNVFYWLKWPSLLLFYLLFTAVFHFILQFQKSRLKKSYQKKAQLAELKLKSIRNQMDPHFIFNSVNAIASAFYKQDKAVAYSYFTKFSKLIRATMLYSDRISRTVEEELDFALQYLEIEKLRFKQKFDYVLNIAENVEMSTEVPRMIIQSYVEAAVSNGLMHRMELDGGLLAIGINEKDTFLEINITDNGVGIEQSKEFNKEKAYKSIRIMDEFLSIINEMNVSKITVEMADIFDNETIKGTEVVIKIPFNVRYKLVER